MEKMTRTPIFAVAFCGCSCLLFGAISANSADEKGAKSGAVRTQLAGAKLDPNLPDFMKFDARQGYYLARFTDGLGRPLVVTLYLFPDPKKNGGYRPDQDVYKSTKLQKEPLPSVRQGYGVNIGDTPQQVKQKLGRAPDYQLYDSRQGRGIYRYKSPLMIPVDFKSERETWEYSADYHFENGALRVIEYEARYPFGGR